MAAPIKDDDKRTKLLIEFGSEKKKSIGFVWEKKTNVSMTNNVLPTKHM